MLMLSDILTSCDQFHRPMFHSYITKFAPFIILNQGYNAHNVVSYQTGYTTQCLSCRFVHTPLKTPKPISFSLHVHHTQQQWLSVGILPLACKNPCCTLQIFIHWYMIRVIFVVTSYTHVLNVKIIMTVIRSIRSKPIQPTPPTHCCFVFTAFTIF